MDTRQDWCPYTQTTDSRLSKGNLLTDHKANIFRLRILVFKKNPTNNCLGENMARRLTQVLLHAITAQPSSQMKAAVKHRHMLICCSLLDF